METSLRHEIKVGIFALVGMVLFCLSIILLGGDKFFLTKQYELKIRLPQATGLGRGSVVTLVGVPVGNVNDIRFVPQSTDVEVVLGIQSSVQPRITEGSKASIKTQGALGDKYVFIEPGPPSAAPLKAGAVIDMDKTPDLIDMIASKGAELGEVVNVIKEVHALFENLNKDGRSARLMSNLVESSENLNKFLVEGRETFKQMRTETLQPLGSVMRKIDSGQGTLGALVNDPSLHTRVSNFFGEAPRNRFLKPIIRDSIQTNEEKK
jgi:phospholipid/cholesterol/gamma-HCH transport system substrate-binding protein